MPTVLQPNVKSSDINRNDLAALAVALGSTRALAEVMYTRGYRTPEQAKNVLNDAPENDPMLLDGVKEAVSVITAQKNTDGKTVIYGDYDADGICAVYIMYTALKQMGMQVDYYIPDRHSEGYGLNAEAVVQLARQYTLLITVDCGISSVADIKTATEMGMRVIVTDHHQLPDTLPDCTLVTPRLPESKYPYSELCGAGIAYKLVEALGLDAPADIAAIATVADIVPLTGENRTIVKKGLEIINTKRRKWLDALLFEAGSSKSVLRASDLAFIVAPRLNAAGRLDDAKLALEFMLEKTNYTEAAARLNALNNERRQTEDKIVAEATKMALSSGQIRERHIIVLANEGWDKGVIGIAASRMAERFHRPCLLFGVQDGTATGSGRSISSINLFEALKSCDDLFIKYGGHAMAAGMSLSVRSLDELSLRLEEYVTENSEDKDFYPCVRYDARIRLAELSAILCREMNMLEPFGAGNPAPRFRVDGIRFLSTQHIGKDNKHIKTAMMDDELATEAIIFSPEQKGIELIEAIEYSCVGVPLLKEWRGVQSMSFSLEACRSTRNFELLSDRIYAYTDALAGAFLKNCYPSDEDAEYNEADFDDLSAELAELLSYDVRGTLAVCNAPATALKVAKMVFDVSPRTDISLLKTTNALNGFNTLLLGGDILNTELAAYRNIVFFDRPSTGLIAQLNCIAPHAEIYINERKSQDFFGECRMFKGEFSRNALAAAYKAMRSLKEMTQFPSRHEYLHRLCDSNPKLPYLLFSAALDVFSELGFLKTSDGIQFSVQFAEKPAQNELTNSKIYNTIKDI